MTRNLLILLNYSSPVPGGIFFSFKNERNKLSFLKAWTEKSLYPAKLFNQNCFLSRAYCLYKTSTDNCQLLCLDSLYFQLICQL